MERKPLTLGAAYHGNRMPHHAREDLRDMMRNGMDLVVHMFSHMDWDRHKNRMKDILELSHEIGLETWVDNWGLSGPPGDYSHFLSYHPEAHQIYSNGEMDPVRICLNNRDFRAFTKEWIDTVAYIGGHTIFWDEPHLPLKETAGAAYYSCACPHCRALFREKFGYDMPQTLNEDVKRFRLETIAGYFSEVTAYSALKGMKNVVCVMLGEQNGISLATLDSICSIDSLDNIGSDPYWLHLNGVDPYAFVYENTRRNLEVSAKYGKDHNIWIQTYATPRGREEEIVAAAEAAYDAGARTIIAWGYYGSESNDYAAENPEKTWVTTCAAFRRIREMERDAILAENRRRVQGR
jgi:hypothetical protein